MGALRRRSLVIGLMVLLLVSPVFWCWLTQRAHLQRMREVKAGRDALVDELPQIEGFETITHLSGESSMKRCYYAETIVVFGTFLPVEEVMNTYTDALQSMRLDSQTAGGFALIAIAAY